MEQKAEKGKIIPFFPYLTAWDRTSLLIFSFSSIWIHTTSPPGSQAFRVGLNYTTVSPGFVAYSQEIVESLSLHK